MNVDDCLRETEQEPPCGPNLEYDDQFMKLESAATGKAEQQFGDTIIAAEEPDWKSVVAQATQLLERSKDLRTVVLLTRGLTRVNGLPGLAEGLELSRRLLERHWDDVHPRLAYDGVVDPLLRSNALEALAGEEGLLRDVRAATLFTTTAGPISVRAAEATLKRESTSGTTMSEAQLRQAAQKGMEADGSPVRSLVAALDHADAIAAIVQERLDAADAPNLQPLCGDRAKQHETEGLLRTIKRLVPEAKGNGATEEAADGSEQATGDASAPRGDLRSREDALHALDAVCRFLERTEPSNPAPLLIRRAQRLIGSGFLDIMRDMAPESLAHIELITGQGNSTPPQRDEGAQ